ncbi:MAG: hypothetical protein V4671_31545, partial [Armatimonadota bacterium]
MRQRSPDFWAKVRTVNWILGGVGLASTLVYFLIDASNKMPVRISYSRSTRAVMPIPPGLSRWNNSARDQGPGVHPPVNYPGRRVNYLAFTGDNRTLIGSGSSINVGVSQTELHAWDVVSGRKLWTKATPGLVEDYSTRSTLMPDKSTVATVNLIRFYLGGRPGGPPGRMNHSLLMLEFLDARTGRVLETRKLPWEEFPQSPLDIDDTPVSIDAAPDGRSLAIASPGRIVVCEGRKGAWQSCTLLRPADRDRLPISRAQFTADGKHLVMLSTGYDGENRRLPCVDVWDAKTGVRVRSLGDPFTVKRGRLWLPYDSVMADLSPDRRRVVTFSPKTHRFVLWDI